MNGKNIKLIWCFAVREGDFLVKHQEGTKCQKKNMGFTTSPKTGTSAS